MEPEMLRRGKEFHKTVQADWLKTAESGRILPEHTIPLACLKKPHRAGRLDIFVDELGDFVSVVEVKSTNWDRIKAANATKLLSSHRRQVWKYTGKYLDRDETSVCAGIIYPKAPSKSGLRSVIEKELNDHGLQVVWYDE